QPRLVREGQAPLGELPHAAQTILVMAAPDVLLIEAGWPHLETLSRARMREALPNLLEESLIQSVEHCHFALGARDAARNVVTVAVVDLAWMRFIHESFVGAGLNALKIIPAQLQQPQGSLQAVSVRLGQGDAPEERLRVISWRGGLQSGWGLRLAEQDDGWQGLPQLPAGTVLQVAPGLRSWALGGMEAGATIDLCQFEFAAPLGGLLERLRPWHPTLRLLGLALLLQLLALNGYWAKLAWQKHGLTQSMQVLARDTVPNAPQDLAPALALKRALENQRLGQGGALPGDFSVLASRLATLLANEPGEVLQQLDYRDESLFLRFKPGVAGDALIKKAGGSSGVVLHDEGRGVWRLSGAGR
ncbi:MAG: hypothetical protein KGK17_02340, partial [Betaproteobacteria bacterium]|nr:hypothetical protein [Betaproteobacteria bacterium]